jgi:hypothetical protein
MDGYHYPTHYNYYVIAIPPINSYIDYKTLVATIPSLLKINDSRNLSTSHVLGARSAHYSTHAGAFTHHAHLDNDVSQLLRKLCILLSLTGESLLTVSRLNVLLTMTYTAQIHVSYTSNVCLR